MKHGAKLGAELGTVTTTAGSELIVEKIVEGGRLDAWNRGRPDKAVKPGDRIVQVNGRNGSSETLMSVLQSMHSEDQLEFVVRRGGMGPVAKKQGGHDVSCVDGFHG